MSGKIKAKGVVSHANGPTSTINDPAKFSNKGKFTGKTPSNGVETRVNGPTLNVNSTHLPSMKAGNHGKNKSMGEKTAEQFCPMDTKVNTVPQRTASGGSTPSYPLKKDYRK